MQNLDALKNEKQLCLKNLNDFKKVEAFYTQIKLLSFKELETLFPAPADLIGQSIFDYTNEILAAPDTSTRIVMTAVSIAISMFHPDHMKSQSDQTFKEDMKLLQALFFCLLKDIACCGDNDFSKIFQTAVDENEWRKPERLWISVSLATRKTEDWVGFILNQTKVFYACFIILCIRFCMQRKAL